MKNPKFECENTKYGVKLAERTARRNGHGGIISVPYECVGRRYERYIDNTTGIITLEQERLKKQRILRIIYAISFVGSISLKIIVS